MDKDLIKKYHLEEAQKRFQQLCEYTFITSPTLNEEGEDDEQMGDENNQPQDNEEQAPMNNQNGEMSQQPNGMESKDQDMEDVPTEEDVPMGDETEIGDEFDIDDNMETDSMQPGDEVIDVDDLTQSQEATEIKIDDVDEKLTTLLNVVNKFSAAIEQNDQKIMDLKAEIERRNPTEEEKLNLRSQATYPYNIQPQTYWNEKTKNSNYNVTYNNDIPTAQEDKYTFTKADLKNVNDYQISKSLEDYNELSDFISF